jgi:hypothetical protein
MRVIVFAVAASLTILSASGLGRAYALPAPAALSAAIAETSVAQHAAYACHTWWQWHGARWVRTCWRAGQEPHYGPWNGRGWYEPCWNDAGWYRRYRW